MTLSPRISTSPASPGTDVGAAVVDDAHLEPRAGPADRGGDGLGVVVLRRRAGGTALGEPVAGDDLRERQLVVDAADQLDRDVGRAGHRDAEARQIVAGAAGVVEDRLVQRRRPGQHRHALGGHAGQHAVHVEHRLGQHGRAAGDAGQDAGLEPEHVEVRDSPAGRRRRP